MIRRIRAVRNSIFLVTRSIRSSTSAGPGGIDVTRSAPRRRACPAEESPGGRARPERRAKKDRRRRIDPTTFDKQYTDDEMEFMNAMQRYKEISGKSFPTYREVIRVVVGLGYRREVVEPDPDLMRRLRRRTGADRRIDRRCLRRNEAMAKRPLPWPRPKEPPAPLAVGQRRETSPGQGRSTHSPMQTPPVASTRQHRPVVRVGNACPPANAPGGAVLRRTRGAGAKTSRGRSTSVARVGPWTAVNVEDAGDDTLAPGTKGTPALRSLGKAR